MKFYRCNKCGNLLTTLIDGNGTPVCCGENTELLQNNNDILWQENHVPEIVVEDNSVSIQVGNKDHPMSKKHQIIWIGLRTTKGFHFNYLNPDNFPITIFYLKANEKPLEAYAYCNVHSIWIKQIAN